MAQTTSRNPVSQEPLQMTLRDYLQKTEDALGSRRIDDALAYCQMILTRFPDALEGQRLLGEVYLAQGHLEEARQSFDWVLINDPENVIAYCSRALVSERIGDVDTALDCYQQAYELSRGNSQIRHVFNQLSKKSGQPGFMLSRAGLARLYMRGSLFSQAHQEWNIVLAQTPDRLDARTGLLELYWLQGRSDLVAQLARQILKTVPDCLKALLLLAYTLAPQDMAQAQELMRHADALDPDQMMAHDLFTDALSRQPNHPFFQLLHNDPTLLSATQLPSAAKNSAPVTEDQPFIARPTSSDDIFSQLSDANNESDVTMVGRSASQSSSDVPEQNMPRNEADNASMAQSLSQADANLDNNPRGNDRVTPTVWDASTQNVVLNAQSAESTDTSTPEPWDLLQKTLDGIDTKGSDQPHDFSSPEPAAWVDIPSPASSETLRVGSQQGIGDLNSPSLWGATPEESTPPDWLNMLTQLERNQLDDAPQYTNANESSQTPSPSLVQPSTPLEQVPVQPQAPQEQQWTSSDANNTYLDDDDDDIGLPTHDTLPAWMKNEEPVVKQEPVASTNGSLPEPEAASREEDDESDDEESFFGPDWLKSLGAASLHGLSTEMPAIDLSSETQATTQESQSQPTEPPLSSSSQEETAQAANNVDTTRSMSPEESWTAFIQNDADAAESTNTTDTSEQSDASGSSDPEQPTWLTQMAAFQPSNAEVSDEPLPLVTTQSNDKLQEQNIAAVLQELEQRYSNGFVPLEPNSLSSIAQAENSSSTAPEEDTPDVASPHYEDSSLSSALAELGRFSAPSNETADSNYSQDPYLSDPSAPIDEPSWLAALRSSSVPQTPAFSPESSSDATSSAQVDDRFEQGQTGQDERAEHFSELADTSTTDATRRGATTESAEQANMPTESFPFNPTPPTTSPSAADSLSSTRPNPLLENELETTMRRPAVRLQPVQQKSGFIQEASRVSDGSAGLAGNGNYREHLLNGYQAQLLGDFDGAMREYRMIIRNAPDLLGDVVSNVRALLKLAPNYSAGYRVLGDAYMRQGEYLQAMESYNKALTMVKKAKN